MRSRTFFLLCWWYIVVLRKSKQLVCITNVNGLFYWTKSSPQPRQVCFWCLFFLCFLYGLRLISIDLGASANKAFEQLFENVQFVKDHWTTKPLDGLTDDVLDSLARRITWDFSSCSASSSSNPFRTMTQLLRTKRATLDCLEIKHSQSLVEIPKSEVVDASYIVRAIYEQNQTHYVVLQNLDSGRLVRIFACFFSLFKLRSRCLFCVW